MFSGFWAWQCPKPQSQCQEGKGAGAREAEFLCQTLLIAGFAFLCVLKRQCSRDFVFPNLENLKFRDTRHSMKTARRRAWAERLSGKRRACRTHVRHVGQRPYNVYDQTYPQREYRWPREIGTMCPFGVFPSFFCHF